MERRLLRREPLVLAFGAAFRLLLLVVMGLASSGADRDLGGLSLIETYVPVLDLHLAMLRISVLPSPRSSTTASRACCGVWRRPPSRRGAC